MMIWSSLRWSDAQWVSPADLVEDTDCLRGLAVRTKSTKKGMPFGLLRSGFLGHTVSSSWVTVWMNLLRESLHRTSICHAGFVPDSIIPVIGGDQDRPHHMAPMTRAQGILMLRKFFAHGRSFDGCLSHWCALLQGHFPVVEQTVGHCRGPSSSSGPPPLFGLGVLR